jgi:hypothetical protein
MRSSRVGIVFAFLASGCTLTLEFDGLAGTETSDASIECTTLQSKGKPECNVVAKLEPGSIGGGIVIDWKQLPERVVTGGFVNGNELVIAVRIGVGQNEGALLGVDLATGARRLVAGVITDAQGTTRERGSGSYLGDVAAVSPVASGGWMAHLWNGSTPEGHRVSLDPDTGSRGGPVPVGDECPQENLYPRPGSVIAADGSIFLAYEAASPDDNGIVRLGDESCELIPVPLSAPNVIARVGSRISFLDAGDAKLGSLDPQSKLVEWVPGLDGYPLGLEALSVSGESAWAIGTLPSLFYDHVNVSTGITTRLKLAQGPAALQVQHAPHVWPHPDGERLLLELDGAIVVLDPGTGESAILSY